MFASARLFVLPVLACAWAAAPAQAGRVLYQECVTSLGNMSDSFTAVLQPGGLFYTWAGYTVKKDVSNGCKPNTPGVPDEFKGSAKNGVNSIVEPLASKIPTGGYLLFYSTRNNKDLDLAKTTLTLNGNPIGTKIGAALTSAPGADPIIDIFNGGSSTIVLSNLVAQIYNSEDPLNPNIFFVPDGKNAAITPILSSLNDSIPAGDTGVFSFALDGSPNWSFLYTFAYQGANFTDLIAADTVPEPSAASLLALGLIGTVGWRLRTRR